MVGADRIVTDHTRRNWSAHQSKIDPSDELLDPIFRIQIQEPTKKPYHLDPLTSSNDRFDKFGLGLRSDRTHTPHTRIDKFLGITIPTHAYRTQQFLSDLDQ